MEQVSLFQLFQWSCRFWQLFPNLAFATAFMSRCYLVLPSRIPKFPFWKNILNEMRTMKAIFMLLDILCCLGNETFRSHEEFSCSSSNPFSHANGFACAQKQRFLVHTATNVNSQIHLCILDLSMEVLAPYNDCWANSVKIPLTPAEICWKMKLKNLDHALCLGEKWTVLVAATSLCQELLCGILKGAYCWPLFPLKAVSD